MGLETLTAVGSAVVEAAAGVSEEIIGSAADDPAADVSAGGAMRAIGAGPGSEKTPAANRLFGRAIISSASSVSLTLRGLAAGVGRAARQRRRCSRRANGSNQDLET